MKKVHLSWAQFAGAADLKDEPPPWDWFFRAEKEKQLGRGGYKMRQYG